MIVKGCSVTVQGGEMSETEAGVYIELKVGQMRMRPIAVRFDILDNRNVEAHWAFNQEVDRFVRLEENVPNASNVSGGNPS